MRGKITTSQAGQSLVEYSLIIALLAVIVIIVLVVLGHQVINLYSNIQAAFPR